MASTRKVLSVGVTSEGTPQVEADFAKIGKAGEDAVKRINAAFAKLGIGSGLVAQLNALRGRVLDLVNAGVRFGRSFQSFAKAAADFGNAVTNTASKVALLTGALAGAAGAVGLFLKNQAGEAERIKNTAEALGLSVEAYQAVQAAANNAGLETTSLDKLLTKFAITAAEAGDATDGTAKKFDSAAQALQSFTVKAEDGSQKLITVRRGAQENAAAIQGFTGAAKGGIGSLEAFAAQVAKIGTAEEKLAFVADRLNLNPKGAREAVTFFNNFSKVVDEASRSANKILEPLSLMEIAIGVRLDDALDSLSTNLRFLKGRIATLFDPAATDLVQAFSDAIFNNQQAISDFAKLLATDASLAIKDFLAQMKGVTFADVKAAYTDLRDGAKEFAIAVKSAIVDIIVPAFKLIKDTADTVAEALNSTFGTKLTGLQLIVTVALLKMIGAFRLLGATITLAFKGGALAISFFRNFGAAARALGAILTGLIGIIVRVGIAMAGLIAANPLIAAVVGLAAAVAYLATRQSDAQIAADRHREAMAQLEDAVAAVKAGVPGAVDQLDRLKTQHLAAAKAALENAQAQVAAARAALDALPQQGENMGKGQFLARIAETKKLNDALAEIGRRKNDIQQLERVIAGAADTALPAAADSAGDLDKATKEAVDSISALTGSGGRIAGWSDSLQSHVRQVDQRFTEAAIAARKLQEAAAAAAAVPQTAPPAPGGPAAPAAATAPVQQADAVVAPWRAAQAELQAIFAGIQQSAEALKVQIAESAVASLTTLASTVTSALAAIPAAVQGVLDQITGAAQAAAQQLAAPFAAAEQAILAGWEAMAAGMEIRIRALVTVVQDVAAQINSILSAIEARIRAAREAAAAADSGGAEGFASGGRVWGPGTGTSDSIFAKLSRGEFVVRASSVTGETLPLLQAINAGRLRFAALVEQLKARAFAAGGIVEAVRTQFVPTFGQDMALAFVPGFAAGGMPERPTARLAPVTFVIDGQQIPGFQASRDAISQLGRFAAQRRLAGAGRKPGWHGA